MEDFRTRVVDVSDIEDTGYTYVGRAYRNGDKHMNNTEVGKAGWLGNPYKLGQDGDREEVIEKFEEDFHERLEEDEEFREAVHELTGEVLACHCHPKKCHGHIIAQYLDLYVETRDETEKKDMNRENIREAIEEKALRIDGDPTTGEVTDQLGEPREEVVPVLNQLEAEGLVKSYPIGRTNRWENTEKSIEEVLEEE